jgi:hypothetical protein
MVRHRPATSTLPAVSTEEEEEEGEDTAAEEVEEAVVLGLVVTVSNKKNYGLV